MALDRVRLESIGKTVPGARQAWHALSRFRQAVRRRHWWKRWVERQPAEVVAKARPVAGCQARNSPRHPSLLMNLVTDIRLLIEGWNERCHPFVWTKP